MKTQFRSKVFRMAWEILHSTGKSFAVCLAKAWAVYRLKREMASGVVRFAFEKVDGTFRKASGTLKNVSAMVKGTGTENFKTVAFFDVDKRAFRCFKVENLITVY